MKHALILCALALATSASAAPPSAEIVSVRKIWDAAPHSAFTDLIRWKDQFVCAFREGRKHVSTDGRIRILTSADAEKWASAALLAVDGYDLRDAGLSIVPDGRLMLVGGAAPRKKDNDMAPTGTFVAFSSDGTNWSKPEIVVDPGLWLWRVTWRDGTAFGVAYPSYRPLKEGDPTQLLASRDGRSFKPLVADLLNKGLPTEATIRFAADGTAYILQRRDAANRKQTVSPDGTLKWPSAFFGTSHPPYTAWKWTDLGEHVGGPNLIELPSGQWIAAGRMFNSDLPKTKLALLDVRKPSIEPILELPSAGDNSYPGMVWHDSLLWVSYYSSHEGPACIYLAKIRIPLPPSDSPHSQLDHKPLFQFTESEVDTYLKRLTTTEPDLRRRIVRLARQNIGQPYELYLLGEMPFETYDPQPIYSLGKSDCLVFTEHTYAMALSQDWPSFMRLLQRIRYRDGQLGVATRNHYTEADWNKSNRWLVEDITAKLANDKGVKFKQTIDRAKFLKNRYGLDVPLPVEEHEDLYLPYDEIGSAIPHLQDGDFVNIVRATKKKGAPENDIFGGTAFVGHVGHIAHGPNGDVHMIHSAEPKVREEPLATYIARSLADKEAKDAAGKPRLVGFKFLRLRNKPLESLKEIDGKDAPRVTLPTGGEAKF